MYKYIIRMVSGDACVVKCSEDIEELARIMHNDGYIIFNKVVIMTDNVESFELISQD